MENNSAIRSSGSAVFISWCRFHGRSDGIARALGIRAWFAQGGRGPEAVRDIRHWRQTTRMLNTDRPDVIVVMQPPFFALLCVARYARKYGAVVVGDLHTGVFNEPRAVLARQLTLRLLGHFGFAIVTNSSLRNSAAAGGCQAVVVHDLVEVRELDLSPPASPVLAGLPDQYVLVPLTYAYDEPIDELLAATRATPQLCWVFTGQSPRKVQSAAPPNVVFSGYLSDQDFFRAISRAGVVVAMTKNESTMQRAAYEALSFARPLVTAKTQVLSEYYGGAAEVVEPQAADISEGVRRALDDGTAVERMRALRTRKMGEQRAALAELRDWIDMAADKAAAAAPGTSGPDRRDSAG